MTNRRNDLAPLNNCSTSQTSLSFPPPV